MTPFGSLPLFRNSTGRLVAGKSNNDVSRWWMRFWWVVFLLLLAGALVGLGAYLFSPNWVRTNRDLSVALHSPLRADYSVDPLQFALKPLQERILAEAVADRSRHEDNPAVVLSTLEERLNMPLPGMPVPTLRQPELPSATPVPTKKEKAEPTATRTRMVEMSPTPMQSSTPTVQPSATRTAQQATAERTNTPFHPEPTSGTIKTLAPTREPQPPTQPPPPPDPTDEPDDPGYPPPADPPPEETPPYP